VCKESQTISSDDYVNLIVITYTDAGQNSIGWYTSKPQKAVIAACVCFSTNFTRLQLTNRLAGQLLGGPNALWPAQPKF